MHKYLLCGLMIYVVLVPLSAQTMLSVRPLLTTQITTLHTDKSALSGSSARVSQHVGFGTINFGFLVEASFDSG